ncbi:Rv3235 family protein [Spirillospora sp. CA-255316]
MPERRHRSRADFRPREARAAAAVNDAGRRLAVVRIVQGGGAPTTDGSLALARQAPPEARRRPHLSLVGDDRPSHEEVAETTVRLVLEVLAGTRPPRHLADRAVPDVWQALAVRPRNAARGGDGHAARTTGRTRRPIAPPRITRTILQEPTTGVLEIAAVVVLNGRTHALALRLDHHRGRWRCTAIETTAIQDRP